MGTSTLTHILRPIIDGLAALRWVPAGMPSVQLSGMAASRLEIISLFLAGLLGSAFVVQGFWNGLLHEFPKLPRLTYRKALLVVFLWGLLFVIVLTMISGARELMTPGAWIRKGNTYALNSAPEEPAVSAAETALPDRREQLGRLAGLLQAWRTQTGQSLPADRSELGFDAAAWKIPAAAGLEYLYLPEAAQDAAASHPTSVVAAEPEFFPDGRLVLHNDGTIELVPIGATPRSRGQEATP